MFTKATPESAGISSRQVLRYLKMAEYHGLQTHSVLIARGNRLICEAYWKPFTKDDAHRMYSQTKSYVGLAVRLLAEDGKISLDDPIIRYFPDKLPETVPENLKIQTIRNMLMMRTSFDEHSRYWFDSHNGDRVAQYFAQPAYVYPGTQYKYDSSGSFVLGALVERITGKPFLDYLREKCLDEIGFSKSAYCLKCPGGHSWADSALLCTPYDMLKFGRLVGSMGNIDGRQIVPRKIFEEAFSAVSANYEYGFNSFGHRGYISQFWKFYGNAVGFNGMHDQFTIYDPDTDITFTCTSGNYRDKSSRDLLISYLFSEIIETAGDVLPEDEEAYGGLEKYIGSLELVTAPGEAYSDVEKEINGRTFIPDENKCGISRFSFTFDEDRCVFSYTNRQGNKEIVFGRKKNELQQFPETGYSDDVGGVPCEGNTYKCASSFAWGSDNQMLLIVQIIDKYIGNVYINFAYKDGHGRMKMNGDAEDFLKEYDGCINSVIKE